MQPKKKESRKWIITKNWQSSVFCPKKVQGNFSCCFSKLFIRNQYLQIFAGFQSLHSIVHSFMVIIEMVIFLPWGFSRILLSLFCVIIIEIHLNISQCLVNFGGGINKKRLCYVVGVGGLGPPGKVVCPSKYFWDCWPQTQPPCKKYNPQLFQNIFLAVFEIISIVCDSAGLSCSILWGKTLHNCNW